MIDRIARKVVQLGFLGLFLYPFLPLVYRRLTQRPAPVVLSWLLPWDPLLLFASLPRLGRGVLVIGAPLLLVAVTLVAGRFFCGWVCPLGTILDLVRPLSPWRWRGRTRRPESRLGRWLTLPNGNSYLKYYLAVGALLSSVLSLRLVGWLDPLVLFQRVVTVIVSNLFALRSRGFDLYLSVSFLFLGILLLELWRPRFWCRHLCPQGALLGWLSRWTLLNRRVSDACNYCRQCRGACAMNAIPKEPHETNYQECVFCLECESACPEKAVSFGFGPLAWAQWEAAPAAPQRLHQLRYQRALAWVQRVVSPPLGQAEGSGLAPSPRAAKTYPGAYVAAERSRMERILGLKVGRRGLVGGLFASAGALALWPALRLSPARRLIRPPGALPEEDFLATCILCQECIRVCPAHSLKPALLEGGLRALGTPHLVAREGGCVLQGTCQHLCARVCPVGAIQAIPREKMRIGLAHVDRRTCLAWDQGARCLVCVEACPLEAALPLQGRVVVDPRRCTGCGVCEQVCPVTGSAIHVTPENEVRIRDT
jgi:MauM/NapG family ferredoxin protein